MATEEAKVVDAVPPPPAYYKLFSPDAPVATSATNGFPLEPPRPPGPGETYKMFGMPYSSEPVAEELLPPEQMVEPTTGQAIDFRAELKALLNSIMANYGQFMEMLVSSPSHAHKKLSDVETLFVNFHSMLNRYRAHQARHLVLERLRGQAADNAAAISDLEAAMIRCASLRQEAAGCLSLLDSDAAGAAAVEAEADGGAPMDVVDDGALVGGGRGGGVGIDGVAGGTAVTGSVGAVAGSEGGSGASLGKGGLLAAAQAGLEQNGR